MVWLDRFAGRFFPRRGTRRVACLMVFTYLAALLQPCAMAMGPNPDQHPQNCHQDSTQAEEVACFSQPALDCVTDYLVADGRDHWNPYFDTPVATLVSAPFVDLPAGLVSRSAYFSRPPPSAAPPLNIRNCVYLK